MRAIAGILHSFTFPRSRPARRAIAALLVVAVVATRGARARAEGITPVQHDALAQMATETLSQGVMLPFAPEQRAALVGLGVAGLYLGTSHAPAVRATPRRALRSAGVRLALPLAGAALGSLIACDRMCDGQQVTAGPLIGALAGSLIAHVLDRDTRPGHTALPAPARPAVEWTPTVSVAPGSYTVGVTGRF
jgi:hypothetical protein